MTARTINVQLNADYMANRRALLAAQDKLTRRGDDLRRIEQELRPLVEAGHAPSAVVTAWSIAKESR